MDITSFNEAMIDDGLAPVPTHWVICDRCAGDGTLGGYPGVYTSDDFAEDPDLFEDYRAHRRSCEDCRGTGKVRVIDSGRCTAEQLEHAEAWAREEAADRYTQWAESGYQS